MQVPSASQWVGAWEQGVGQDWVGRGLTLLAAAHPDKTREQLAALSIGARDAALFALREHLFGRWLRCVAECPACGSRLEFSLDGEQLSARASDSNRALPLEFQSGEFSIRCRPLDSEDLARARACTDVNSARQALIRCCVLEVIQSGQSVSLKCLDPYRIEELGEHLARSDDRAETPLTLQCAECAHCWQQVFDIVSFLWAEIGSLAKRYLHEVHTLAWAYGWREADILGMSPARRRYYLDRVG